MARITWLSSYPKSGNTWMRAFLANLKDGGNEPVPLNHLCTSGSTNGCEFFKFHIGYGAEQLTQSEIESLKPAVFAAVAKTAPCDLFIKSHEADRSLVSPDDLIVYIVRNPLDVCISLAHHLVHGDYDRSIAEMADEHFALNDDPSKHQSHLYQRIGSWSRHVLNWMDSQFPPAHVVRYEDMIEAPLTTFTGVVQYLGIDSSESDISRAIQNSSFDVLRNLELMSGFSERPSGSDHFFRKGRAGAWKTTLTERQIKRVLDEQHEGMKKAGYV